MQFPKALSDKELRADGVYNEKVIKILFYWISGTYLPQYAFVRGF